MNAEEFWSHELLGEVAGLADNGGLSEGNISGEPFRLPIVQLEDPAARAKGYTKALRWMSEQLPTGSHEWSGDEAAVGREKIRRALGRDYTSYDEFVRWMWSNSLYFRWSPEAGHLIVDRDAKEAGEPLIDDPRLHPIEPWKYWWAEGMDWLVEVIEEGEWVRGGVMGPEGSAFRVPKSLLRGSCGQGEGI